MPSPSPSPSAADPARGADPLEDPQDAVIDDPQGDPASDPQVDPAGDPAEDPGGEEGISSLTDLADYVAGTLAEGESLPENWLEGLTVPVQVNRQEQQVPLKDLIDGFQMRDAAERGLAVAKARAKELTDGAAQKVAALDEQFAVAAKLIQSAEQYLDDDVGNIDWAKLRREDPAEYAAKRDDIAERRAKLQALKDEAVDGYRQGQEKLRQVDPKVLEERVAKVEAYIVEKLPDWSDAKTAEKGTAELTAYLAGDGFTPEQIRSGAVQNPCLLVYAEKARRYDALMSKSDAMKKKIVKVPKVLKPGGKKAQEAPAADFDDAAKVLYG